MTHRGKIAIEVGHDSEAITLLKTRKQRRVDTQSVERVVEESLRDAAAGCVVATERATHAGGQLIDRVMKRERRWNRSYQCVVRRVEHRIEALGVRHQPLVLAQSEEARFPGVAVGVERPAEVEQHAADQGMRSCPPARARREWMSRLDARARFRMTRGGYRGVLDRVNVKTGAQRDADAPRSPSNGFR